MNKSKIKKILKGEAICKHCIFYSEEFFHCTNSDHILEVAERKRVFVPSTIATKENSGCKYFTSLSDLEPAIIEGYKEFVESKDKYYRTK